MSTLLMCLISRTVKIPLQKAYLTAKFKMLE